MKNAPTDRYAYNGINIETLTDDLTLYGYSAPVQYLDPDSSNRDVNLPALGECIGKFFTIKNAGAANDLVVKTAAGATHATLTPGDQITIICNGALWTTIDNNNSIIPAANHGVSAAMVAGVIEIACPDVVAGSTILFSRKTLGTADGHVSVTAISDGVSFTLTSDAATETSTFSWMVLNA